MIANPVLEQKLGGFVLAGGRSSRMGFDKALLELEGETLLDRAVRQLRGFCAEVGTAGGIARPNLSCEVLPDHLPGNGPLSGIVTALEWTPYEWNLFVAVDTPFLPDEVWTRIVSGIGRASASTGCTSVIARSGAGNASHQGDAQPLCAAYRRHAGACFRSELESGRRKVLSAAYASGDVYFVDFENSDWFRNINTPEDLKGTGVTRGGQRQPQPPGEAGRSTESTEKPDAASKSF